MELKMISANLEVSNLERTTKFYTALGFKNNSIPNEKLTSFLLGEGNFVIYFFLKEKASVGYQVSDSQQANEPIFTLSVESKDKVNIYAKQVELAGGKLVSRPKESENGYYGFVFADPDGNKFNVMMRANTISIKSSPPYLLGILCIIPLVGAFVGLGLLLYGLLKYKDKWLSIIGAAGILWTTIVYASLFFIATHFSSLNKGFVDISQMQLNSLVKDVEYYKLVHGQYPDSLKQLLDEDKLAPIHDAVQGLKVKGESYYNYKKNGDKYLLFSSGQDGKANTKDDLFPQTTILDSSKNGL